MKTGVSVADAMTPKPVIADENKKVRDCARLMLTKKVGSLVIVAKKKLVGILTEKDIIQKVVAKDKISGRLRAKDIMTKKVLTIGPNADLLDTIKFMEENKVRRLPVIAKDKELLGLVTIKDLLKIQPQLYDFMKEKVRYSKMEKKKESYKEGECESCGAFGQLYNVNGQLLCEECKDEEGEIKEEEAQEED